MRDAKIKVMDFALGIGTRVYAFLVIEMRRKDAQEFKVHLRKWRKRLNQKNV